MGRIGRGLTAAAWAGLAVVGASAAAADDLVLDSTKIIAERTDGATTAEIRVINLGDVDAVLRESPAVASSCVATISGARVLPPRQPSTVTVTFAPDCFPLEGAGTAQRVDLDADGPLPAVTVTAPARQSPWLPLAWGALFGAIVAVVVGWFGRHAKEQARAAWHDPAAATSRMSSYRAVQDVVNQRLLLRWNADLPTPAFGWRSSVHNLASGWSFQDSFVTNLGVGTTALVALVSSTDVLTAVLGDAPKSELGMIVVAGLISALVIAVANTLGKVLGPDTTSVTTAGFALSAALVTGATAFQIASIVLVMDPVLAARPQAQAALWAGAFLVTGALIGYAWRVIHTVLANGIEDVCPRLPDDAATAWAWTSVWHKAIADERILSTYQRWLQGPPPVPSPAAPPAGAAAAPAGPAPIHRRTTAPMAPSPSVTGPPRPRTASLL